MCSGSCGISCLLGQKDIFNLSLQNVAVKMSKFVDLRCNKYRKWWILFCVNCNSRNSHCHETSKIFCKVYREIAPQFQSCLSVILSYMLHVTYSSFYYINCRGLCTSYTSKINEFVATLHLYQISFSSLIWLMGGGKTES